MLTFWKEEEQAQLGGLAERDDNWFKTAVRGRETLEQWLVRTVAEGTNIDKTAGTDHTEWIKSETFPGNVAPFACDKEKGTMAAKMHTDGTGEISFRRTDLDSTLEGYGSG